MPLQSCLVGDLRPEQVRAWQILRRLRNEVLETPVCHEDLAAKFSPDRIRAAVKQLSVRTALGADSGPMSELLDLVKNFSHSVIR